MAYCAARSVAFWFVVLLVGCADAKQVESDDVSDVLTQAAMIAARDLPASFCAVSKLAASPYVWPATADKDGWIRNQFQKNERFRKISAPEIGGLPRVALVAFERRSADKCRHTLVFSKPEFIETKTSDQTYLTADVAFSDYCPLCGSGYVVRFRKTGEKWVIEPPGIVTTWAS